MFDYDDILKHYELYNDVEDNKLLEHQIFIGEYMNKFSPYKEMLLYHDMGTGKTLCALNAARKNDSCLIITKNENIKNIFKNNIRDLNIQKYRFSTFITLDDNVFEDLIIVDEAHHIKFNSDIFNILMKYIKNNVSAKLLLLTGTPITNNPEDLLPIFSLLLRRRINKIHDFDFNELKGKVSRKTLTIYEDIVKITTEDVNVKMPQYNDLHNISNAVYNGIEVHSLNSKYDKIIDLVIKEKKKLVLYCDVVKKHGIFVIYDKLKQLNIKNVETFTGADVTNDKLYRFNEGKIDILLCSPKICEGITLKNVRTLIICNQFWNSQHYNQLVGRVRRFQSHLDLDPEERDIKIINVIAIKDNPTKSADSSIDLFKRRWCNNKDVINNKFLNKLQNIAINLDYEYVDEYLKLADNTEIYDLYRYQDYIKNKNSAIKIKIKEYIRWMPIKDYNYDFGEYININNHNISYIIHNKFVARNITKDHLGNYLSNDEEQIVTLNNYIQELKSNCKMYSLIYNSIDKKLRIILGNIDSNNKRSSFRGCNIETIKKDELLKIAIYHGYIQKNNKYSKQDLIKYLSELENILTI